MENQAETQTPQPQSRQAQKSPKSYVPFIALAIFLAVAGLIGWLVFGDDDKAVAAVETTAGPAAPTMADLQRQNADLATRLEKIEAEKASREDAAKKRADAAKGIDLAPMPDPVVKDKDVVFLTAIMSHFRGQDTVNVNDKGVLYATDPDYTMVICGELNDWCMHFTAETLAVSRVLIDVSAGTITVPNVVDKRFNLAMVRDLPETIVGEFKPAEDPKWFWMNDLWNRFEKDVENGGFIHNPVDPCFLFRSAEAIAKIKSANQSASAPSAPKAPPAATPKTDTEFPVTNKPANTPTT